MGNKTIDLDFIRQDVRKILQNTVNDLSNEAQDDLLQAHSSIISDFYYTYDPLTHEPHIYDRTGNLDNSLTMLYSAPQKSSRGQYSSRAVAITSYNSMDEVYKISASSVFDLMWNQGVRGLPEKGSSGWINDYYMTYSPKNIKYYNTTISGATPHDAMVNAIEKWGKAIGKERCEKIINAYR